MYIAPFPFPPMVVDATGPNVSMEKIGTAVVEVASVHAYRFELMMVEVALPW